MGGKHEKVIVKNNMCAGCDRCGILPDCIDYCLDIRLALLIVGDQ